MSGGGELGAPAEQDWSRLTSGDGGGDVDLGDSEHCEGRGLFIRVKVGTKP